MTPLFTVMTPFLEGHGDSRYVMGRPPRKADVLWVSDKNAQTSTPRVGRPTKSLLLTPRKRGHNPLILGNDPPFLKGQRDSRYV